MGFSHACPPRPDAKSSAGVAPRGDEDSLYKCLQGLERLVSSAPQDAAGAKRLTFRRRNRLLQRSRFVYLSRRGRRRESELFILCYDRGRLEHTRIGMTVTKKVGGAVVRNRIKRVCREFFRHQQHRIGGVWDLNVIAKRQAASRGNHDLSASLAQLFKPLLQ